MADIATPLGFTTVYASRPSPGRLWEQAHVETKGLPSWERGEACGRRYDELMRAAGYAVRSRRRT
jgi:hypothetical protein